jgi:hypothetical protein
MPGQAAYPETMLRTLALFLISTHPFRLGQYMTIHDFLQLLGV